MNKLQDKLLISICSSKENQKSSRLKWQYSKIRKLQKNFKRKKNYENNNQNNKKFKLR